MIMNKEKVFSVLKTEINIDSYLVKIALWAIILYAISFLFKAIPDQAIMRAAFWGAAWAGFFTYSVTYLNNFYIREQGLYTHNWLIAQDLLGALEVLYDTKADFAEFLKHNTDLWTFNIRSIQYDRRNLKAIRYLEVLNEIQHVYSEFDRFNIDMALFKEVYSANYNILKLRKGAEITDDDIKLMNTKTSEMTHGESTDKSLVKRIEKVEERTLNAFSIMQYILKKDKVTWLYILKITVLGHMYIKNVFEANRAIEKTKQLEARAIRNS